MSGFRNWKLRTKVVIPALAIMTVVSVALGFMIYTQQKNLAITQARQTTRAVAAQIAADRATYTQKVVTKLQGEKLDVSFHDMKGLDAANALPLPASFVHLTSGIVDSKGFHTADLVSRWNINPDKGPKSEEVKRALIALEQDPSQTQEIVIDRGADPRFIEVSADIAAAQGCVDCHNSHPASAKHDFRLNDVMGGLVVSVPLAKPLAEASTNAMMLTGGLVGMFALVLFTISAIQWAFISKPLVRLEKAADQISLGELDSPILADSKDEVGNLAKAFERMRVSLSKAMEALERG
jgi:methyl-accepting chemotaxis protein